MRVYAHILLGTNKIILQPWLRLDYDTLMLNTDSGATSVGNCNVDGTGDVLRVSSTFSGNADAFPPPICGSNNGQHSNIL